MIVGVDCPWPVRRLKLNLQIKGTVTVTYMSVEHGDFFKFNDMHQSIQTRPLKAEIIK